MVRVLPEVMVTEPWLPPAARVPPDQLSVAVGPMSRR